MDSKNFITNSKTRSLRKRLYELIHHSNELKFLVGFFYFSGLEELYDAINDRDDLTIKILVGLDVDEKFEHIFELAIPQDSYTTEDKIDRFFESLGKALNAEELDQESFFKQVHFFVRLLEEKRLLIRKTIDPNHAKLYLFKIKDDVQTLINNDSRFITGSSNLTSAGLQRQHEFNVEIGDYGTKDAETYFDELWETSIPITEIDRRRKYLVNLIRYKSQAAYVTPYEAYVHILKTYLDLMEQKKVKPQVKRLLEDKGYTTYQYQLDAVNQALSIIEQYNGVIIADVVGLGKSIIASMIAKNLGKRGMIISPPGLMGDREGQSGWHKYINDFKLYDWELRSSGKLEKAVDYLREYGDDIEVVIIDEAHRFRNQDTADYELLNTICRNRIVILMTATPFNNSPADIFSLLKLFIVPGKSKITLDNNLEGRFNHYDFVFQRLSYISKYGRSQDPTKRARAEQYFELLFGQLPINMEMVKQRAHQLSREIRYALEPVLIRRNRIDLVKDSEYRQEVTNLSTVENPEELYFGLDAVQLQFYDKVINEYFGDGGVFKGAIYQPFNYEKKRSMDRLDVNENRAFQQQRNLFEFMRRLLVKRFESSFGSFRKSIENFERIHEIVLKFIENSGGRYILDRRLIEKIYEEDVEEIDKALEEFARNLEENRRPKHDRIYKVNEFEFKEAFINDIKSDLALMAEVRRIMDDIGLTDNDPKADRLIDELQKIIKDKSNDHEPHRKVIIFSEYVDTVHHLQPLLDTAFPEKVLTVDGQLSATKARQLLENFDAGVKSQNQKNQFQILLTSDKLSEGLNLNRAGAIINYDIPWNPTRVIQRVGRINRIGQKVFEKLQIYNFFPTERGASIVKSREIASQKMFLIHNTIGEDAKIFDVDEEPTASELFNRINNNPEENEEEGLYTKIKNLYGEMISDHPGIISKIDSFPARIKTAKHYKENQLSVFRRKGLGFFVQSINDTKLDKPEVTPLLFEEALPFVWCGYEEPKLDLSNRFWKNYEFIKNYREVIQKKKSEVSVETKAMNNLKSALKFYKAELDAFLPFIRTLIKDLRDYKTLPKFTLRRLASEELKPGNKKSLKNFIKELKYVQTHLGEDYLRIIQSRLGNIKSEVIIAVENIKEN